MLPHTPRSGPRGLAFPAAALVAALMLAALALGLPACGRSGDGPPPPNVVIVVVDALRADAVGCYGYARPTSRNLDAFARAADLYARAMASAPWTVPSHASMFTGLPPYEHGAHTFAIETPGNNVNPLLPDRLTLAEALAESGWRTGAFVANDGYMSPRSGLDQGFATWHVERLPGVELNERILGWLDTPAGGERDRPFFLFVNYMDTHGPYNATPRPELDLPWSAVRDDGELLREVYEAVMPAEAPPPPELVQRLRDQYDLGVVNADLAVGELLAGLSARGLLENAFVVLTSDHGEYFGEHALVGHSKDVYQEALQVPLLVRRPGQRQGRTIEQVASLADLPRLVLAACGPKVQERWRGAFPDSLGNHPVVSENYYTRPRDLFDPRWGHRFRRVRTALFEWPHKYIHSSDGAHELYDLAADPRESRNLLAERPAVAAAARDTLQALTARRPANFQRAPQAPLTADEMRRLRALGYVR